MTIAIIEDNNKFRDCLSTSLALYPECDVVHTLNNALNIEKYFNIILPQFVLLDLNMPGINGLDALKFINNKFPTVQVVMLTINAELETVVKCMQYGAKGFLVKDKDSIEKIVASLNTLHSGNYNEEFPLNNSLANKILHHFVKKEMSINTKLTEYKLTPRQKEVLISLHEGKSYKQIAEDLSISSDTLNAHVKAIYPKLNIKSRGEINRVINN